MLWTTTQKKIQFWFQLRKSSIQLNTEYKMSVIYIWLNR